MCDLTGVLQPLNIHFLRLVVCDASGLRRKLVCSINPQPWGGWGFLLSIYILAMCVSKSLGVRWLFTSWCKDVVCCRDSCTAQSYSLQCNLRPRKEVSCQSELQQWKSLACLNFSKRVAEFQTDSIWYPITIRPLHALSSWGAPTQFCERIPHSWLLRIIFPFRYVASVSCGLQKRRSGMQCTALPTPMYNNAMH